MDTVHRIQTHSRANILRQLEPKPYPTVQLELRAREKIHEQRQSTLLSRLPLEIRVMIYQMVLLGLGHTRHMYSVRRREVIRRQVRC
jgi:hypothetical protein